MATVEAARKKAGTSDVFSTAAGPEPVDLKRPTRHGSHGRRGHPRRSWCLQGCHKRPPHIVSPPDLKEVARKLTGTFSGTPEQIGVATARVSAYNVEHVGG